MSDIRNMTTEELAKTIAFHTSYSGSHVVNSHLHELTRRLEAAESKAATYWAECEAWRAWHDDTSDRGTSWLMELATNVDKARAANDAARAANNLP